MLRHLFATRAGTRRRFPGASLEAIEQADRGRRARTSGEIRFVVETALDCPSSGRGTPPRERAHADILATCASGTPNFATAYSSMY